MSGIDTQYFGEGNPKDPLDELGEALQELSRRHNELLKRVEELGPLLEWMGDFSAGAGNPEDVMDKILTLEHHIKELRDGKDLGVPKEAMWSVDE